MKEYNLIQLDNGIRVLLHFQKSVITHSCILVNTGSRNEQQGKFGMAHFIEHLVFKRTEKRSTNQILNRLEHVGGDLNAYTTKEYTCLHASFLNPYLERALDLFEDVLFHSTFPDTEIEKERGVVLDEIASYLDSPEESIMDDFEDLLFQGSGLGHNILGLEDDLKSITKSDILRFMQDTYNTSEIVIAISGDYSLTQVKRLAERIFGKIKPNLLDTPTQVVPVVNNINQVVEKPINQAHYMLGGQTFGVYDERKTALLLLNNMLGGYGMSSILNLGIREKYGIAYTIESNFTMYKDTGSISIYLGTDEEKLNKAVSLVFKELNKLKNTPVSEYQLTRAKQKFKGQIALAEENRMSMVIAEAKNIIDYGRVIALDDVLNSIDKVSVEDLFELSNIFFDDKRLVSLKFMPEK
ncbi:M16 family metallopeptidase [Sphingobacterium yanglingense]|uniref:Putative Zn-dependent peptidase n=1 Tax=Sphingobacterium yanglingense TaxID=1437280 RepID=A0A4R6W8F7_9SPHI|nr:pitrilysin family protein [Sphingobacterium yanglingense]TDQ73349.1 putative Zn-dependent peptidase [Sphingobacterium yanglingense]